MQTSELFHIAALSFAGAVLFLALELLILAVCRRNAALTRWYYFLATLPIIWLVVAVVKAEYSETFNWIPDSIDHDIAARHIADLISSGKFGLAVRDLRANNYGFRFVLGLAYAFAGSPPPVAAYIVNSAIALSALILFLDVVCHSSRAESISPYGVLLVGLLPTALFWATAINKEALMLLGVSLMLRLVQHFESDAEFRTGLAAPILGLLICGFLRPHVAMCWFAGIVSGIVISKRNYAVVVIACLACPLLFLAFKSFKSDIVERFESEGVTETMTNYQKGAWGGGSEVKRTRDPIPFFDGMAMLLLRPYPDDIHNAAALLTSIEIWIITGSLIVGWLIHGNRRGLVQVPLTVCAIMSLISLSFFFTYMQNLGYMSRQRLQAFPAILILTLGPFLSIPSVTGRKDTDDSAQ